MKPVFSQHGIRLYHADALDQLPALRDHAEAVVTDPPYGLGFMGKHWADPAIARLQAVFDTPSNPPRKPVKGTSERRSPGR